jgi:hypothetical protein
MGFFKGRTNCFFIQKAASYDFYFEPNSVIVSDIRSDIEDDNVHEDNLLQFHWSKNPNVLFGTYKFRYPYVRKVSYDIFYDYLFIQASKSRHSAECRMYISEQVDECGEPFIYGSGVSGEAKRYLPEQTVYEEKHFHFNKQVRFCGSSCNDCRLREYILSKFVILPYRWAMMFGFQSDREYQIRNDLQPCAHVVMENKYLSQCYYCNWRCVIDPDYYIKKGWFNVVK